jgi:conjugative relaxase-like TrwC/TraI family protein
MLSREASEYERRYVDMLRITCSENAKQAKSYYTTSLKHEGSTYRLGNYYAEEQEIIGMWQGKGAERLGLSGRVDQKSFEALCDNHVPGTRDCLTVRMKENRRVGYDFNFNCPKSVSVVQALTGDERILGAFRESVAETMRQIESEMNTRVRIANAQEDRRTGNMVWGEFIHFTARPVEGKPDPHLHAHCFAFNATYDPVEKRWKAGEFSAIKRAGEYYEAAFHARLAQKVADLGYAVGRSGEWWEIQGVSRDVLEKFSQRTEKIEKTAKEQGISDAVAKERLGALTRERKVKVSMDDLKREWTSRLTPEEKDSLLKLTGHQQSQFITSRESMDYALAHCYERASVVTDKQLVTEALWHGIGHVGVEQVERQLYRDDILTKEMAGQRWCTTKEVLGEEVENIQFVQKGCGRCRPLNARAYTFQNDQLGQDQKDAVRHVMISPDRVMAIRGPAGAGKTTMMQEAVRAIEAGGHKVFTFAPSAESSRGTLREEGFGNAQTVAHLLKNESLHPQLRGQVLWIDEAGLLSARQMRGIFQLAGTQDCRVILSGDTRQHTSVERGDALRLLETYAGLKSAELTEIRRQKDAQYREAVREFSRDNPQGGFEKLDQMGAIRELPAEERYRQLAHDYADTAARRKSALVVSPTHAEGERVTALIREELKQRGKLGTDERKVTRLINQQWTEAQLSHASNYRPGLVVQFHQNAHGFTRGQRVTVSSVNRDGSVDVQDQKGREQALPLYQSARFQVCEAQTLPLAPGDKIRITQNGFAADGKHRLNNGAVYQVQGFSKNGDLKLSNGWVIGKDYGNLAHGYCQTSHVAQSKTVDRVFVAQSMKSFGASSAEQFYVSISRARESVTVYTDDKARLAKMIQTSGARMSAHELLKLPVKAKIIDPFESMLRDKIILPESEKLSPTPRREGQKANEKMRPMPSIRSVRGMNYFYQRPVFRQPRQGISL